MTRLFMGVRCVSILQRYGKANCPQVLMQLRPTLNSHWIINLARFSIIDSNETWKKETKGE